MNRRELLKNSGLGLIGINISNEILASVLQGKESEKYSPVQRYPRMVHRYFMEQVQKAEEKSLKFKLSLKTKEDAENYQKITRKKIQASFGPFPEKTPLNPRITKTTLRDGYQIENIIFESRPDFPVTANLYMPTNRNQKIPGVIGTCGHSLTGKGEKAYQSFAQGLARQGYACLIYDPIGQGERIQYADEHLKSRIGVGVREHLHAGNQQFLVGEFLGLWRAWDGIRALDYLLSRDEIDPNHIGVTGNSGGGTMTTWLCGLEDRWTMGAPSCFVTTFRRNMQNELPADTEQCPPKAIELGLDHDDFIAMMAPNPVVILAKEKDYFDVRGSLEAYHRLKHLYKLLGAEENVSIFIGPTTHGFSIENREAMYRCFNKATGVSNMTKEPELKIESIETLTCSPKGQVASLKPRTIYSFTKEKSQQLANNRGEVSGEKLIKSINKTLKLQSLPGKINYRIPRAKSIASYPRKYVSNYLVETEKGIDAVVYRLRNEMVYSRPQANSEQALLYISDLSSDSELREDQFIREIVKTNTEADFYSCDVRGIGDSKPNTCGGADSYFSAYGNDFFYSIYAQMLNRPYVGQRTFDVLVVLKWLEEIGYKNIHLIGKGWGALPATFASVLSSSVNQVTLKNPLTSYTDIAESEIYHWPLSSLLMGVLEEFDLPDCYRELKKKNLTLIDPAGANVKLANHG